MQTLNLNPSAVYSFLAGVAARALGVDDILPDDSQQTLQRYTTARLACDLPDIGGKEGDVVGIKWARSYLDKPEAEGGKLVHDFWCVHLRHGHFTLSATALCAFR